MNANYEKRKMKMIRYFIGFILTAASTQAYAEWTFLGGQGAMKNYAIVDAGDISSVRPPSNTEWERKVYQLNDICFYFGYGNKFMEFENKAALLLINSQKDVRLAVFEPFVGAVKVELHSITTVKCP